MTKLTKLTPIDESIVEVTCPVSDSELINRISDYPNLSFVQFSKKYRGPLYTGVTLNIGGEKFDIQTNFCTNPFCRWFGLPQFKYTDIFNRPSRYGLTGTHPSQTINCKHVNVIEPIGVTFSRDYLSPMSNWSVAQEIKRLIDVNSISPMKSNYQYHREECADAADTPFNSDTFWKRGKSTSNSQKYQCKSCGKITNVLPSIRQCFTYHQKKNDILPSLMLKIVGKTPITRILEELDIGASTYYNKIEWLHRRCLEFLERHETNKLKTMKFSKLWLNTDKFIFSLNNIRKKGHGSTYYEQERLLMTTHIIATVDARSRYTFRNDLAYDFNVKPEDIQNDIEYFKEDKLQTYAQKNARYRHSYYGNRKFKKEDFVDDVVDDILDSSYLDLRKDYVDGLHINSTYTAYAQYWLIRRMLNVDKLNIVCDDDRSLINSIMRVYSEEIRAGKTNVFTCQVEKSLTRHDAYNEYYKQVEELNQFEQLLGLKGSKEESAILMLADELSRHSFYNIMSVNGKEIAVPSGAGPLQHPMPYKDEGIRYIDVLTNLSDKTNFELAKDLFNVNMQPINTYFNQLRRRSSLLERPIVTARGDGRSYIYASFNPKYTHFILTILRTYLNFCDVYKYKKKEYTPAMRLGIADRPYTVEDIIYFK